jgi:hypothetical protein
MSASGRRTCRPNAAARTRPARLTATLGLGALVVDGNTTRMLATLYWYKGDALAGADRPERAFGRW